MARHIPHGGIEVTSLTVAVPCRGITTDWFVAGPLTHNVRGKVDDNRTVLGMAAGMSLLA